MITGVQFTIWAKSHPDLAIELGDLAEAIQLAPEPSSRWTYLQSFANKLIPDVASLLEAPKCDTLSFPGYQTLQRELLDQIRQRAGFQGGAVAMVDRGRDWLVNLIATIRLLMYLLEV